MKTLKNKGNSETSISEMISKMGPKRGRRPQNYPGPYDYDLAAKMAGGRKLTRRMQQNHLRAQRAFAIIGEVENWSPLYTALGFDPFCASLRRYFENKVTLLSQLGRLADPKIVVAAALEIAEGNLRGEAAVGVIQRHARGGRPAGWRDLHKAVRRAVGTFKKRHPELSDQELVAALDSIRAKIVEELKGQGDLFPATPRR